MASEARVSSPTGGQKGTKPCQLFSLPPWAVEQLGRVYGHGAEKYAAHNYRKGYPVSLSINAAFRHLLKFLDNENVDPESGEQHLAHAAWHMLAALQTVHDHPQYDDRWKGQADTGGARETIPMWTDQEIHAYGDWQSQSAVCDEPQVEYIEAPEWRSAIQDPRRIL